jgi:putative endonuclease
VAIAQWLERCSVEAEVSGSSPVSHPVFYAYVLKSLKNNRFYYGCTNNPRRRLAEHNNGKSKYTQYIKPFKLVYFEKFKTLKEARKRETFFKSGQGREFIKKILNND